MENPEKQSHRSREEPVVKGQVRRVLDSSGSKGPLIAEGYLTTPPTPPEYSHLFKPPATEENKAEPHDD